MEAQDYKKLVKALRCKRDDCEGCDLAFLDNDEGWMCQYAAKDDDAAAAIEALQAQLEDRTNQDEQDKIWEYLRNAPVGPIGPIEPMRIELLQKRGKWVEDTTTYAGPGLSNYKCSLCGKICGTWRRGLEPSELPNWCGNCGADMRKKGVQINGFNKK